MSQFQELLQRIDSAKALLDSLRPLNREQEDRAMQKFRLWWTYHSNAIEGNTLTQGETEMFLMEGLTAKGKPLKDHLDLRGHSNAINFLLAFIRDKEVLTEAVIRELHKILLVEPYQVQAVTSDGRPTMKTVALGQYKTQANHVRTPTGEIHYYATPEETPAKMHDLMHWYRDESAKGTTHLVEIAARFHYRFTDIHPFDDGNGRMSRLLMNLMLMQAGYPPSVIRLGERDQYLAALRQADAGEFNAFLAFISEHVVSSLGLFIRAVKGEEIHEPTDLEKEIALLKLELSNVDEPQVKSPEAIDNLFLTSFDPLYREIVRLLTPLCELFSESYVNQDGNLHALVGSKAMPRPSPHSQGLHLQFILRGFKKARFNTFEITANLEIDLEKLKYRVALSTQPRFIIQHFYQEPLASDEVAQLAQQLARVFVEGIKAEVSRQN